MIQEALEQIVDKHANETGFVKFTEKKASQIGILLSAMILFMK